jgi:hypothetical protein
MTNDDVRHDTACLAEWLICSERPCSCVWLLNTSCKPWRPCHACSEPPKHWALCASLFRIKCRGQHARPTSSLSMFVAISLCLCRQGRHGDPCRVARFDRSTATMWPVGAVDSQVHPCDTAGRPTHISENIDFRAVVRKDVSMVVQNIKNSIQKLREVHPEQADAPLLVRLKCAPCLACPCQPASASPNCLLRVSPHSIHRQAFWATRWPTVHGDVAKQH